ncbi:hypothetical protein [Luteolibacter sp. LG18]|uniref:hypothetical protein n=1 Tax=Luteolibacter sp. LG18 TaxID=2819286 RepID=UPI002B2E8900|nr:hypothetical protein llg_26200 [Luteolibacter sp. LG18]
MKYRPSRLFVASMSFLLGAGAVWGWAWKRASDAPGYVQAQHGFLASLGNWDIGYRMPMPEDRVRLREPVDQQMRQLETEFPALGVEMHPVPDEQNGYLQMHLLGGGGRFPGFPGDADFRDYLANSEPWDANAARQQFSRNAELVGRVERIAALKHRSSAAMPPDFNGFISQTAARYASTILLMKARLAAEGGDEAMCLRYVELTGNLANHFHDVETPNILGEAVRIMLDLEVQRYAFQYLLPALGKEADLVKWKAALARYRYTPADFADVVRGEYVTSSRFFLLPSILDDRNPDQPNDAATLARVYASTYEAAVNRLRTVTCCEWATEPVTSKPEGFASLSGKSREFGGLVVWNAAGGPCKAQYLRAIRVLSLHQAAIDLLALEKQGIPAATGPVTGVTRDPVENEPFIYDAYRRTLAARESGIDGLHADPVRLPW